MFRDYENRYLVISVVLVLALTGLVAWYEVAYRTMDSWPETVTSIGQGVASAIAVVVTILASVEVIMLFSEKYKARRFEEGREEGKNEGRLVERQEHQNRLNEAYERFGIVLDGVQTLPRTPEVEEFLSGKSDRRTS